MMESFNITILAALFLGGVLFIVLAVLRSRKAKMAAENWPTVAGGVLSSEVVIHRSHSSRGYATVNYMPKVSYEYQVNGQKYMGDGIGFGTATFGKKKADEIAAIYPQGTPVTVHYDPSDPSKAVLETKSVGGGNFIALGIILIATGFMYLYVIL
jgi:hypothetical protein